MAAIREQDVSANCGRTSLDRDQGASIEHDGFHAALRPFGR
jgi:hypothetical protein